MTDNTLTASKPLLAKQSGKWQQAMKNFGLGAVGLVVLLLLWAWAAHWLEQDIFIARMLGPKESLISLWHLLASGEIYGDILASLRRVGVSLLLSLLIGVPVGLAVGTSKLLNTTTSGAFQFLRMISPLSWMPIAVMVFGIGDGPIYFLLTITAVWPIILNTSAGVQRLDPSWLSLAKSLSATRLEVLFKVVLPGILGNILTGSRLAIGMIWILLVPCEMLGVQSGLGYFILDTRDRLAYDQLMATIVLIGILGFLIDGLARKSIQLWTHDD